MILLVSLYAWSTIEDKRTAKLHDSDAFSVLETLEGQSPYTDLQGDEVSLINYFGNVLVVSSWASWCPDCSTHLPLLDELAVEYADKGVQVLAINRSEPATTAERFLRTVNATSAVVLVLDPDDKFYKSVEVYAMPETIFYDTKIAISFHSRSSITL